MKDICGDKTAQLLVKKLEEIRVSADPRLKWCVRADCENIVRKPICCCKSQAVCTCGQRICFKCGEQWHEGRCQYEGNCLNWLRSDLRPCPKCHVKTLK